MKKKFSLIFLLLPLLAFAASFQGSTAGGAPDIVVHNRPLASLNGKIISTLDVKKKMDLFLYENYPDIAQVTSNLYQYYMSNWKATLESIIEDELISLDATEKEQDVSEGDIREEMEARFGPNVVANLEKLNLGFEEARQMISTEQLVQKMLWFKVHAKALQEVTPKDIQVAYRDFAKENPPKDHWTYQMLTIRSKEQKACEAIAKEAYSHLHSFAESLAIVPKKESENEALALGKEAFDLLSKKADELEVVSGKLKETHPDSTITLSKEMTVTGQNLAPQIREVLHELEEGTYSEPISQKSRDQSIVYRIFYLKAHDVEPTPSFNDMSDRLKNQLLSIKVERDKKEYIAKLREKYSIEKEHYEALIPSDFVPFTVSQQ